MYACCQAGGAGIRLHGFRADFAPDGRPTRQPPGPARDPQGTAGAAGHRRRIACRGDDLAGPVARRTAPESRGPERRITEHQCPATNLIFLDVDRWRSHQPFSAGTLRNLPAKALSHQRLGMLLARSLRALDVPGLLYPGVRAAVQSVVGPRIPALSGRSVRCMVPACVILAP